MYKSKRSELLKKRKKTIYDLICSKNYKPMRARDIASLLQISKTAKKDLLEVLDILEAQKKIEINAKGYYQKKTAHTEKSGRSLAFHETDHRGKRTGETAVRYRKPEGQVTSQPGEDITKAVLAYGIPTEFPAKALQQADRCPSEPMPKDYEGRLDLRNLDMVTIDGEDARDLDDAVSLTKEGSEYRLGVHIADVSNYVQGNSALDREALKRGTSTYLADRVLPMLPKKLSNGICSLNEGEDRLALSCIMKLDKEGRVISGRIAETVICVTHRMTYPDVNAILTERDAEQMNRYADVVPMLFEMHELSRKIRELREKRGAIDFDFPETKIRLDKSGHPVDVYPNEANAATKMIEDFMLTANETVAKTYFDKQFPFLYRTHEKPDPDKIEAALKMVRQQGFQVTKTAHEITPGEVQKIIDQTAGTPQEAMISRLLLRSMQQARYTTDCIGHFGLAAKYYCHFTSPIRRYPDLQIHRIIKDDLRGRMNEKRLGDYKRILEDVAWKTSALERRSIEAERETNKMKMAEYMLDHLGEEYDGMISGVTSWGFYVELPNTIEGLVHVISLKDDYYEFSEEQGVLKGRDKGRKFTLGQPVRVQVKNAFPTAGNIDFVLAEAGGEEKIDSENKKKQMTGPENKNGKRKRHQAYRK